MGRFFVTAKKHRVLQDVCDSLASQRDEYSSLVRDERLKSRSKNFAIVELDEEKERLRGIVDQSQRIVSIYIDAARKLTELLANLHDDLSPLVTSSVSGIIVNEAGLLFQQMIVDFEASLWHANVNSSPMKDTDGI